MELKWKENLNVTPVLVSEEEDVMKAVQNMEENIENKVNEEEEMNKVITMENSNKIENEENEKEDKEIDDKMNEEKEDENKEDENKEDDEIDNKENQSQNTTKIKWYDEIPENEKYQKGDIIYNSHYDKFGIFNQYGVKKDRIQMNLLCKNSKEKTFEKPWRVPTDSTKLVKRDGIVEKGFVETETGFEKAE